MTGKIVMSPTWIGPNVRFTQKHNNKNREDREITIKKIKRKYHSYHVYTSEYYWRHIKLNGTADSYFEYVVLNILGCQFSLVWHANYNTFMPMCTKRELLQVLESLKYEEYDKEERAAIAKIDPTPSVLITNKQAVVRLLVYAINQGFIMRDYYINKHFPHKITKIEDTQLVDSKINITF